MFKLCILLLLSAILVQSYHHHDDDEDHHDEVHHKNLDFDEPKEEKKQVVTIIKDYNDHESKKSPTTIVKVQIEPVAVPLPVPLPLFIQSGFSNDGKENFFQNEQQFPRQNNIPSLERFPDGRNSLERRQEQRIQREGNLGVQFQGQLQGQNQRRVEIPTPVLGGGQNPRGITSQSGERPNSPAGGSGLEQRRNN